MKEKDILKEIEETRKELVRLKKKMNLEEYATYKPWEGLEKLKSKHMWDDIDDEPECPSSIRVREAQHEVKKTGFAMPGTLWGVYVGEDD